MSEQIIFDEVDKAILECLQLDATITNADLAKRVGLSPSASLARTKRLREAGVVKKIVAIVDEKKIGLEMTAFVFITLAPHNRVTTEAFLSEIQEIPQIMECYNVSGKFDYLLKVIAPSTAEYRSFIIDKLIEVTGVGKVETLVVLSSEKLSHDFPLDLSNLEKC